MKFILKQLPELRKEELFRLTEAIDTELRRRAEAAGRTYTGRASRNLGHEPSAASASPLTEKIGRGNQAGPRRAA